MNRTKDLVIVGNGMATCRLLDELVSRRGHEQYRIQVIGEEAGGAYNRVQLSKVLGGAAPDAVVTKPPRWYDDHGIRLHPSRRVDRLEPKERRVFFDDGESVHYDVAVLSTGSQPIVPPLEGMNDDRGEMKPGLFVYRTIDDCMRIRAYARPGDTAVVLGGGLLGLEAAKVLVDRGLHVTVVHLGHGLMNTQLDFVGGEMLRRQIEHAGLFVRTGRTLDSIVGSESVEGVLLDDGEHLSADLVVLACGVRPRVEVAKKSKIPVNKGILVNDALATQVPGVYAIGECTEHAGVTFGLVAPAWEQATVLAELVTGTRPLARYHGTKLYSRLKVAGVDVAALGAIEPLLDSDQVIQVIEERKMTYRKLIVRDKKLIGAMFVGDVRNSAALIQSYDRDEPLPDDPLESLCSFSATGSSASTTARLVCNCHKVTETTIREAIAGGADEVELVVESTRAGSGCGSCKSEIARLVAAHATRPLPLSA